MQQMRVYATLKSVHINSFGRRFFTDFPRRWNADCGWSWTHIYTLLLDSLVAIQSLTRQTATATGARCDVTCCQVQWHMSVMTAATTDNITAWLC